MQRTPHSTSSSRTVSGCLLDGRLATELADRLKRIVSPRQFSFYDLLETAAFRLGEQQQLSHLNEVRPNKIRPAYKTLTALTLGANSFKEIESLELLTDEALSPRQLVIRRDEQAARLEKALLPFADEGSKDNIAICTRVFVEIWQPSAKEFDPVDELLTTPGALTWESLIEVSGQLESYCHRSDLPPVRLLFQGLAFAVQSFYAGWRVRRLPSVMELLVENLGWHAVDYANVDTPSKVRRAISVFQVLWGLGHVPAGLHLVQIYFEYTSEPELHQQAALIIDVVWSKWSENPGEFTAQESVVLLFKLRARARSNVILHCNDEDKVCRSTVELIDALYQAGKLHQGYKHGLGLLLIGQCNDVSSVDPESWDAIRSRIHQFPSAKAEWQKAVNEHFPLFSADMSRGGSCHE